ncbi:hypothetical protein [Halodurantibacterium flavum]|uniref:Uncharacterized protein n=1 Tax=Halodurantibacterium flavum TaxID=1382802 RepID=A0ABW4S999_9RHOB
MAENELGSGETDHKFNTAALRMTFGRSTIESEVSISSGGLLAIGGLVSSILLSVTALVWVSTRKLPEDSVPPGIRKER